MSDPTSPSQPIDSRQAGFNPEVEASHAAAAAAEQAPTPAAPASDVPSPAPLPAPPRAIQHIVADAFEFLNGLLGNAAVIEDLIAELRNL